MTQAVPTYVILSRVHVNQWDNDLQETVPGWLLKVRWSATGTILPVFIPDGVYTPETIDKVVRASGKVDEQIHSLGR